MATGGQRTDDARGHRPHDAGRRGPVERRLHRGAAGWRDAAGTPGPEIARSAAPTAVHFDPDLFAHPDRGAVRVGHERLQQGLGDPLRTRCHGLQRRSRGARVPAHAPRAAGPRRGRGHPRCGRGARALPAQTTRVRRPRLRPGALALHRRPAGRAARHRDTARAALPVRPWRGPGRRPLSGAGGRRGRPVAGEGSGDAGVAAGVVAALAAALWDACDLLARLGDVLDPGELDLAAVADYIRGSALLAEAPLPQTPSASALKDVLRAAC